MEWTEIKVTTTNEASEAVTNILMEAGASGVALDAEDAGKISAYYPETIFVPELLPQIRQRIQALPKYGLAIGAATVTTAAVDNHSWATAWQKYYHPVRLTRYLTVAPSWEAYQPQQAQEQVIRLDPGQAFGTGTHPTTKLALTALEMQVRGGETMLDVGTGSGVLSIAAKQFGVGPVYAYDVDDVAVASAQTNFALNPIAQDISVQANDLLAGVQQPADLIVANILAEIIVPLIPQAVPLLKPNGHLILSGIIADKVDLIKTTLAQYHLQVTTTLNAGDWFALIATQEEK